MQVLSQVLSHLLSETVERCCVRSRVVEHHDIVALRSELDIDWSTYRFTI